ncbi:MAG: spore germination protein [Eubacteriales bacterium]
MEKDNVYKSILDDIELSELDIKKRELKNGDNSAYVLYIEQLTDKPALSDELIRPLMKHFSDYPDMKNRAERLAEGVIHGFVSKTDDKADKIIGYILDGMSVTIIGGDECYLISNTKKVEKRGTESPHLTYTLRGPRDSFTENLDSNLSLIRYRVKDPNLCFNYLTVGRRSKTKIVIIYIGDVANDGIVNDVTNRIKQIDVDGLTDSGQLQKYILNKKMNLFPQMGIVERSDMAARQLLDGKVIVLMEGSFLALSAPQVFSDFFVSCDDVYDNRFIGTLMKVIRIISTFLALCFTAVYVAILNFHIDTLPASFIVSIRNANEGVPFTVLIGALLIEIILELLREALLRVPKQIGSGVGIVGGIVIGQSAIAAKIFSPLLLIVVALSMLSSFTAPDYTIMNPLRIIKFALIVVSGCFGLVGFVLLFSIIIMNMISMNSFGVAYTTPSAPLNLNGLFSFFVTGKDINKKRPYHIQTKDQIRSSMEKK